MTTQPLLRSPRSIDPITHSPASYVTNVVGTADQLANLVANHRAAGRTIAGST